MIRIISRWKEGAAEERRFQTIQELLSEAAQAPAAWMEHNVLLVEKDGAVLYSSLDGVKSDPFMRMTTVVEWFRLIAGIEMPPGTPGPQLYGQREIREGDFYLKSDAAKWSRRPNAYEAGWMYRLTPHCSLDEVLGPCTDSAGNSDIAHIYLYVHPGCTEVYPALLVERTRVDGDSVFCERAVSEREELLMLWLVQASEIPRLYQEMGLTNERLAALDGLTIR